MSLSLRLPVFLPLDVRRMGDLVCPRWEMVARTENSKKMCGKKMKGQHTTWVALAVASVERYAYSLAAE